MVHRDRLLRTFLDLVEINSPSKAERGVADYLKPRLEELGFTVVEDDTAAKIDGNCGNVIGSLTGTSATGERIFLGAHMDTVEPTPGLEPIVTEDCVVRSDGKTILGADDKAGIAAIIEAVRIVLEKKIPFKGIQVVFTVSEEIGLLGARYLDRKLLTASAGYVFDTEKPVAGLVVSAPSHVNLLVKIHGKAAHAGIHPDEGVSAILAASKAIASMKLGRIDHETTANIGIIQGGKARNIVPDYVEIRAEARSRDEDKLKAQVEHMVETFERAASEIGARAEVEVKREYSTYRWTENDLPVKFAQEAARSIGIEAVLVEGGGGSDANIFNELGIPAVVVGVGYEGAHSRQEHIAIDDLAKITEFIVALIAESAK